MKRFAKYAVCLAITVGVLVGLGQIYIARSHADANSYISSLDNNEYVDFYGSKADTIQLGYRVCADFAAGFTFSDEVDAVRSNPHFDYTNTAAAVLVLTALKELC